MALSLNMKHDLKPGGHVHFMGICGTAMASLAGLMKDRGYHVTGSDQNVYPPMSTQLENLGIKIMEGYRKENLSVRPDLVVVGNVISKTFPEAEALLESDIPYTSLPALMGEVVIDHRHSIVVSGTHGKTTTTSLMSWIASCVGLEPGFMIGGIPKNFGKSYQVPKGDFFVIEGDEYDTAFFDKVPKFTHYRPTSAILTSIEFDHADIYRDLDHVRDAFRMLLRLVPAVASGAGTAGAGKMAGRLVYNAEDANIRSILQECRGQLIGYGLNSGDYQAREIVTAESLDLGIGGGSSLGASTTAGALGTRFKVLKRGEVVAEIQMQMIGEYNVKNALAAFALSMELGWPIEKVVRAIGSFEGVKRRQDIIGVPGGVTLIEDFAHHPTAVEMTIKTVQARYPKAQVFSIFEPRSATSRRSVFQKEYAQAFSIAQRVLMPKPYNQTSIPEDQRFSSELLMSDLKSAGVKAELHESVDQIVASVKAQAHKGDVVLIMSNGGFDGIYQKLKDALA